MDLSSITPLVLTYDEAPNIGRALERLGWASRIVVVDSGSTDGTLEILGAHPAVQVHHRRFDSFARQCNFGIARVESEWVLSMDADYIIGEDLVGELAHLDPDEAVSGFRARFRYCVAGRPLHATLYPPRTVLYRRARGEYVDDGHAHRLAIDGPVHELRHAIDHDDRKPLSRWLDNQRTYAIQEADKLLHAGADTLGLPDRLRRRGVAPLLVPFYCLFVKGLIRDGAAGWRYTLERTYAELLLALEIADRRAEAGPR